uniref:Uncharacterized protein n=1 Tax=Candidatus Nitrotoga fabula TaxID=2182327 RepID=A0A2X0QTY5_9PROT|nr:exported protein of unknown function [Candidatus Nitrotoga fabula]
MKAMCYKLSCAVLIMLASGLSQAVPITEAFVHAEDRLESTAACLVTATNSNSTADCLCATGNNAFSFCAGDTGNGMIVNEQFAAAWAAEVEAAETVLDAPIAPWPNASVLIDARASCTLDQASLDLALTPDADKSKLKGVIGAKAQYSAIYMYPTINGDAIPGMDPVRLCALGQASVIVAGSYAPKRHHDNDHDDGHKKKSRSDSLNLGIQATDIGITGAFQWALTGDQSPLEIEYADVGVKFVLVAGVADAVVKAGKGISAVGVLANTKISNRSLHVETKQNLMVLDQNP